MNNLLYLIVISNLASVISGSCYWNSGCPYVLYSSKTPYDTVRGDVRDFPSPDNCEAISLWSLNRHGNRNPGGGVTERTKNITRLKDEIIRNHEAGMGELCAQDVEEFRKWTWNSTLEDSPSFLTGTGYEEIYNLAARFQQKYPQLFNGSSDSYYFRPTHEQRTITSAMAYVHGIGEGTNLNLTIDGPWEVDNVIRAYDNCDRFRLEVRDGPALNEELDNFRNSPEYTAVSNAIHRRLGLTSQLTRAEIYTIYEICRFYRSWTSNLQSPWCAAFSDEDLITLEYQDDVRHYYRNGYGSWVNVNLGYPVLDDLYQVLASARNGEGRKVTAYFTHDSAIQMAFSALGVFKDEDPIRGASMNPQRVWRTSHIAAFSTNIAAVLNRCQEPQGETHRVQIFINEKETELCPLSGCTWQQFEDIFQKYHNYSLDFCSMDYVIPSPDSSAYGIRGVLTLVLAQCAVLVFWR